MVETGVIHGRFQVLHNDHLRYILAGRARCRHLVVAITNPDPVLTRKDSADPRRSDPLQNPLTYFERYTLVRAAMSEAAVSYEHYSVVPLPINLPALYPHYVPMDAVFYLTIYDGWGRRKLEHFQGLRLKTEVLWWRAPENKGLCGTDIRRAMVLDAPWEHLVPPSVAKLLHRWNIPQRLRKLSGFTAGG